ncbi:MAG: DUF932 domain-containing protein [Pirellulaceae bacterium]
MAHEINVVNGRASMAYFGDMPWHGLGQKLDNPATAAEAIQAAGLDFGVDLRSLKTTDDLTVPQRKGVVRTDTNQVLGVVGNSYVPIQNAEAFQFLDTVVSDGELRYHTAGALGRGERIWMLAKLPGQIRVNNTDDITEQFLLLSNSHDATSALRVYFTPIRVVCANTLGAAERRSRGQGVSIIHKGDLGAKVREAQKILGLATRFYEDVQIGVNRLADYQPTREQLDRYFRELYPNPTEGNKTRAENVRQELFRLFESGKGQDIPGVRGTAWAAFNSITEYVDHVRPARGRNTEDRRSRRLESSWFGSGALLKAKAWTLALDMVTAV